MYCLFIMLLLVLVGVVCLLVFLVSLSALKSEGMESTYECGFDSSFSVRSSFSYRFFLIAIVFLIFDVEIALMLPIPYLCVSRLSMMAVYLFMGVLLVGLVYEIWWGSLDWV